MSDPNQPSTPPGWYPDGRGGQRWWDGKQWTEHTQPQGGSPAAPDAPSAPPSSPADAPTQIAPHRAAPQQPPAPQQPAQPSYGPPAGQAPFGQPQQQPFGGFPASGSGSSGGGKGKLIAIIGGALGALLLVVVAVVVLLSLVGGGSPEDVADDYLEASGDGEFEKACELSSDDHRKSLLEGTEAKDCDEIEDAFAESFEEEGVPGYDSYQDFFDDLEYDYEIGDVKEKDDTATVEYTYTVKYTGDDEEFGEFFNEEDTEAELELVKEDGDWLVDSDSGNS